MLSAHPLGNGERGSNGLLKNYFRYSKIPDCVRLGRCSDCLQGGSFFNSISSLAYPNYDGQSVGWRR